jgi:hypothetical protein
VAGITAGITGEAAGITVGITGEAAGTMVITTM